MNTLPPLILVPIIDIPLYVTCLYVKALPHVLYEKQLKHEAKPSALLASRQSVHTVNISIEAGLKYTPGFE